MDTKRDDQGRRRAARRRRFSIESLERRALLSTASEAFVGPSLGHLVAEAHKGKNTTQAQINVMVDALQSQLQAGPLADLKSGTVSPSGFITESQALEASYEFDVDQKFAAQSPNVDELLKLQGQRVVANLTALNQQEAVGLIAGPTLVTSSQATISSLSAGPILAIGTTSKTITSTTKAFATELTSLEQALGNSSLTLTQVNTTLGIEAEAYRTDIHAGIQMAQLRISGETDTLINALESSSIGIAQSDPSTAQSQLAMAVSTFDAAVQGKTGLFSPKGALSHSRNAKFRPGTTNGQAISKFTSVSGTANFGGPATLTATLTQSDGSPLMGESVGFTVNGAFAGVAVTNFTGVATLNGVANIANAGTATGSIVAYFASDTNYLSATGMGNLAVSQTASLVSQVSGTATFGGPASLSATLTSPSTGQALAGQAVSFSLGGTSVGTAITNGAGVATLAGAASSLGGGTNTGAVVASFAGAGNNSAGSGTGDLVVGEASTMLSGVGGTAAAGGTATLTATLISSVTNQGAVGETVNFTLNGTSVGSAVTASTGVATLSGVANTSGSGTQAGAVAASFAGDTNYFGAPNATGDLVVSQGLTALLNVGGTASFGGTATLKATLTSTVNSLPIASKSVNFTLNGVAVGTAVTDSGGVATLTGVPTTAGVGTDAGAVVATYVGDTNNSSTTTTGDLVVSQAATTLGSVGGTASFGGKATVTATLTSSATNQPLAGQTISFTLAGTTVGTAVTNGAGVATLAGLTENDAAGTISGAVVANYSGGTDYSSTGTTGNLVISKANTAIGNVAGTASFGGNATLTATLTSSATSKGIPGETVVFLLSGAPVGKSMTDSNGVATLTSVSTTASTGTDTGAVAASFAGDDNYDLAMKALGDLVVGKAGTSLASVAGTASFGGTATLTATLTSTVTSQPLGGETVNFTLSGTAVGTAVTNSAGVATLTGVATTATAGTHAGAVVASFAGDPNYSTAAGATGDLVVGKATTALGGVAGTALFGGTATLTATLTSSVTSQPLAGQTVSFTLAGTAVGTALTNGAGVATLTGVATTAGVGTDTDAVVASFAGDTSYLASNVATGNLVISPAPTVLASVSGGAFFGGQASLSATLTSSVTGAGLAGQTVSFTLDGVVVGTAVTSSSGVASLTGVATNDAVGTDTGGVVASFAGVSSYSASSGTGNLVVSQAPSVLSSVSGTSNFGAQVPYTLTATLTSPVSGLGLAGKTIFFTLDNAVVGTGITNASGVATLMGTTTRNTVGTDTGGVTAIFNGDADYLASSGDGDLVVSKAPTTLSSVSGTAPVGGPATLVATFTSLANGLPIPGETIFFSLDGVPVGTAVTDANGIATLAGVPTSDPAGTDSGGVFAIFPGDANYVTITGTGDLTVS